MKKVMVFGTFDNLHPGHIDFFRQACALGRELVVVVARDRNAELIKGRRPQQNEQARLAQVSGQSEVDRAVLGNQRDRLAIVREIRPDVIGLGYDQEVDLDLLKSVFSGEIIRLEPYEPEKYKSSKIRNVD